MNTQYDSKNILVFNLSLTCPESPFLRQYGDAGDVLVCNLSQTCPNLTFITSTWRRRDAEHVLVCDSSPTRPDSPYFS